MNLSEEGEAMACMPKEVQDVFNAVGTVTFATAGPEGSRTRALSA